MSMSFEEIAQLAVDIVWNPILPIIFLFIGLYLTVGMGFFQFRKFGLILKSTIGSFMTARKGDGPGILTSFQAWAAASGSAVGMGNIAGVSSAVALGGPGALFWMWVSAFVGMATKMGEVTLAVHYKDIYPDGKTYGGPTFYMEKGLGKHLGWPVWLWKSLAGIFITGLVITMFIGMASYSIQETFQSTFSATAYETVGFGLLFTILIYIVILGGIKRVGRVAEILLPAMAILYILGALGVIFSNFSAVGDAFAQIFQFAFTPHAAVGGVAGFSVMKAVQVGVARGVYSNEAGWGTSPMIHATAKVDHPVRQGLWGAFEVFLDTIIICTVTGLVVVITGIWETTGGGGGSVAIAFESVYGPFGKYFIFVAMFIFVFTTSTGWYSYYETLLMHVFRGKSKKSIDRALKTLQYLLPLPTYFLAAAGIILGILPKYFWLLGDLSSGMSVYVNLVALLALSPVIFKLVKDFEKNYIPGKGKGKNKK